MLFPFLGFWGPIPGCFFFFESTHACTVLCEALAPRTSGRRLTSERPCFQGLPGLVLARRQGLAVMQPLRSCSMALLCRRGPLVHEAKLLSVVSCRTSATSDSCSCRCILLTRRLVVSGHLSTSSALLIDLSAEPVESFLPCSWQTLAPLHAGTRLATPSCRALPSTLVVRPQ